VPHAAESAAGPRCLLIEGDQAAPELAAVAHSRGWQIDAQPDPYAAMLALARRPLVYRGLLLALDALYPTELTILRAVGHRYPHVERLVCRGTPTQLAEAEALGATPACGPTEPDPPSHLDDPDLTPDEIRALLAEGN
jgi:hypothetical protein